MRICITNDDGIWGEGLSILVNWAKRLGEVVIYAPKVEQSAKSHAIEIHKSFEMKEVAHPTGVKAYAVDSTPADCVRLAILGNHEQFDLVFSGINKGLNIGRDIIYSGTVSAAFEAAALGVKAIALSTDFFTFETAEQYLDTVWDFITGHELLSKGDVWNVNIPVQTTGEIRFTHQGGPYYSDDFAPEDNDHYRPMGKCIWANTDDETLDTNATLHHRHISITPLTFDRTDWTVLNKLL
ncbi:MAG: 5'/3'-nucleotidase SurE [Clostridia bacterium]|nr:5'/3'-nucleotidase SurE [Clostridia bacterium]